MRDFKHAELCRYVTMTDTVIYPFAVVMNMDSWNSLPEDVRKVFEDMGGEQSAWTGACMDDHVKKSVEFTELPKEEKARWDNLLALIVDEWIRDAKACGSHCRGYKGVYQ